MDSLCIKLNQLVSYGTFYFDSHLKEHLMEEMGLGEEAADRILNVSVAFSSNWSVFDFSLSGDGLLNMCQAMASLSLISRACDTILDYCFIKISP